MTELARRGRPRAIAPEAETAEGWSSMDTAPKDAIRIAVKFDNGREVVVRWRPTRRYDMRAAAWVEHGYWVLHERPSIKVDGTLIGWRRL